MEPQRSPQRGGPGDFLVPHRYLQSTSKIHHKSASPHPKSESLAANLHPKHPKAKNLASYGQKGRHSRPVAAGVCRLISPTRSASPLENPSRNPPNSCLDSSLEMQIECPASYAPPPPSGGAPPQFVGAAKTIPISSVPSSTAAHVRSWADVVRSSSEHGVQIPPSIEENRKDVCSRKISNQWQQPISDSERSLIFKKWARGRCFRCLAFDHQVRSCKAPFRCIRCFGLGHRERYCCFQATSSSQRVLPYKNHPPPLSTLRHRQMQTTHADFTAKHHSSPPMNDVANEAASQEQQPQLSLPSSVSRRMAYPDVSAPLDNKEVVSTLLESLRSDLMHLFEVQFEIMLHPIREEMSVLKVWLARVATHFECQKQDKEHLPAMGVCAAMVNSFTNHIHAEQSGQKVSKSSQAVGQVVDVVLQENAFAIQPTPNVHMATKDIDFETKVEEKHADVDELNVLMNDSASSDVATTMRDEKFVISTSPMTTTRHRRHPYVKKLLPRNKSSAPHNILKDLGFIQKNGKLDVSKLDVFADVLKEHLPQELLVSLMKLEGPAFWEVLAKILDPLS